MFRLARRARGRTSFRTGAQQRTANLSSKVPEEEIAKEIPPNVIISDGATVSSTSGMSGKFIAGVTVTVAAIGTAALVKLSLEKPKVREVVENNVPAFKPLIKLFDKTPSPAATPEKPKKTSPTPPATSKPTPTATPAAAVPAATPTSTTTTTEPEAKAADHSTTHPATTEPTQTTDQKTDNTEQKVQTIVVVEAPVDSNLEAKTDSTATTTPAENVHTSEHGHVVEITAPTPTPTTPKHDHTASAETASPSTTETSEHTSIPASTATETTSTTITLPTTAAVPTEEAHATHKESESKPTAEKTTNETDDEATKEATSQPTSDNAVVQQQPHEGTEGEVKPQETPAEQPEGEKLEERLESALLKIDSLLAIVNEKEAQLVQQQQQCDDLLREQKEEHFAFLEHELNRYKEDFTQALEQEKEQANIQKLREIQEHLSVQKADLTSKMQSELAEQAQDIRLQTELDMKIRLASERSQRIVMLEKMFLRLKAVEGVLGSHSDAETITLNAHLLFLATQDLATQCSLEKPLKAQVANIDKISRKDQFVQTVIKTIPQSALDHGVVSSKALIGGFAGVKSAIRRVGHVDENGGLWSYFVSYLSSVLTVALPGYPEGDDTEAIIARADYWIRKSDINNAARELNQLKGAAKRVASDWLKDARANLEVNQAINILNAHVCVNGLSLL